MLLYERHKHERDAKIFFDEEPHIYYIDGVRVDTSVTSFIHNFFPHFNAKKIAKMCFDKAKRDENSKYRNMSIEDILQSWEENRDDAANKGTFMHKSIELFYNEMEVNNDTKEWGYFKNFQEAHKNFVPYRTEWEVYHEELNLAGSIDMTYLNKDDTLDIFDWKRSREIKKGSNEWGYIPIDHIPNSNFWHYSLQLNMYKYILETKYNKTIRDMYLVVLHPDEYNYRKIQVPVLKDEINSMVTHRLNSFNHLKNKLTIE